MSEHQQPYLHIAKSTRVEGAEEGESGDMAQQSSSDADGLLASAGVVEEASTASAASTPPLPANGPLESAIMHAAVGWVELCVERQAHSVDITPVAKRLYEVSVHYASLLPGDGASGEGIILRVRLEVEPGLVLRTVVEPVRP